MAISGVREQVAVSWPFLVISLVFLLIAVLVPGASTADTIWAYIVGVVAAGALTGIVLTALAVLERRSKRSADHEKPRRATRSRWRWLAYTVVAAVLLVSLDLGPEDAAYLAGGLLGFVIGVLSWLLLDRRQRRLTFLRGPVAKRDR